jgi:hypothetical protein
LQLNGKALARQIRVLVGSTKVTEDQIRTPSADSLQAVLRDARDFQWATLQGAYGRSDAKDHYRDVPGMLLALANAEDVDSGSWGDAYDDAFLAHIWHQYTIYPVTPLAIGFVTRIASIRLNTAIEPAKQIALGLRLVAKSTAMYRRHAEAPNRELGEACAKSFTTHGDYIRTWLETPLKEDAFAIGGWIPELGVECSDKPDAGTKR